MFYLDSLDVLGLGMGLHLPEDDLLVVCDDVLDALVVVEQFLMVTAALFGCPSPHPLGHPVENLELDSLLFVFHDVKMLF